jgi:putative ABC transport system permease protein
MLLLSAAIVKLVVLAAVIATPLAWFVMNKWLEGFAYRVAIGRWVFAGLG